ncbi:hypothetical protein BDK51DRAFT_29431 [Blyttiomyces helicus]|uniref:Uncharacterized protein n=1 Tax=Blyttiomyces helicus TaxID=388810 RepID=A0A4P9WPA6_9FUNG|nr:hypothetical protein BDK51DRAFT_29431 [Blyttiomyces helicus]|eukprot:RKO94332.1 hypothetical protein BDK51DRAFT_29431 [Blyttiomyces helicus]
MTCQVGWRHEFGLLLSRIVHPAGGMGAESGLAVPNSVRKLLKLLVLRQMRHRDYIATIELDPSSSVPIEIIIARIDDSGLPASLVSCLKTSPSKGRHTMSEKVTPVWCKGTAITELATIELEPTSSVSIQTIVAAIDDSGLPPSLASPLGPTNPLSWALVPLLAERAEVQSKDYALDPNQIVRRINNMGFQVCSTPRVFFEFCPALITFITFGRYLGKSTKMNTSLALSNLISLELPAALLVAVCSATARYVQAGGLVKVVPGECIPADSIFEFRSSSVSEALKVSNLVISGTVNGSGSSYMRTHRVGNKQIVKVINKAQMSKPQIQDIANTISGCFDPTLIALGVAIMLFRFAVFFWLPNFPTDSCIIFVHLNVCLSFI